MPRVFLSHSSRDSRSAIAVKAWLIEQEPGLAEEIFLDLDPHTGIRPGERWKQALQQANTRCEAVICLLSQALGGLPRMQDRIPLRRDAEQDHPVRPAGAVARYRDHLGVAALRPVCRRRPDRRDRRWMAGRRWCCPPRVCSGCWTGCAPWGSGPSTSRGRRRAIRTGPRTGGGRRWRRPMRRCSSGATPRSCAGWTCCAGCAPRGCSPCS